MEKLYKAKDNLSAKVIGRSYPQVVDSGSEELIEENRKYNEEEKFDVIPSEGYSVKIGKSAKLTDILSSFMAYHSPIISEKLVEVFNRYTMPRFKLIPIKIYKEKELMPEKKYYIMHFSPNDISNINFKKSEFEYSTGGAFLDKSLLHFESHEDYMERLLGNKIQMANITKVVMKPTLRNDLFHLDIYDSSARYVKQRLKDAIEENNITGFRFIETGYVED